MNYKLSIPCRKKNSNVIVKPVDKGCGIVLISRESYDQEVQCQINIDDFYTKLNGDLTQSLYKDIDRFLESAFNNQMISKNRIAVFNMQIPS